MLIERVQQEVAREAAFARKFSKLCDRFSALLLVAGSGANPNITTHYLATMDGDSISGFRLVPNGELTALQAHDSKLFAASDAPTEAATYRSLPAYFVDVHMDRDRQVLEAYTSLDYAYLEAGSTAAEAVSDPYYQWFERVELLDSRATGTVIIPPGVVESEPLPCIEDVNPRQVLTFGSPQEALSSMAAALSLVEQTPTEI